MERNLIKAKQTKRFARRSYLFVCFALFVATIICGTAILVWGQKEEFAKIETIFLPLVSQPETVVNSQTLASQIHWNSSAAPFRMALGQAVVARAGEKEYLYLFGGGEAFRMTTPDKHQIIQTNRVARAEIYPNGSLGTWSSTSGSSLPVLTELPMKMYGFSATAVSSTKNDFIYLLGGLVYPAGDDPIPIFNNTAFCARLGPNGDITEWKRYTNAWELPSEQNYGVGVAYHATVVVGNRIYLIGGMRRNLHFNRTWDPTSYVYSAEIGDSCGVLDWELETELPFPLKGHTAVAADNGNIYVFGGRTGKSQAVSYRAQPNGIDFGNWITQTQNLHFTDVQFSTAVQSGDYLYVIGGTAAKEPYDSVARDTVYRTKIGEDDNIQSWQLINSPDSGSDEGIDHLYGHTAVTSQLGRIYVIGGVKADGKTTAAAQAAIRWTPLVFFHKENTPSNGVVPGQEIVYKLTAISNNVRDIMAPTFIDTLPDNVELLSAPGFIQNGQTLSATISNLPVGYLATMYIKVVVPPFGAPSTPPSLTPTSSIYVTPLVGTETATVTLPTPEITTQPAGTMIRPTADKSCVVSEASAPDSGTPRPKPTCTPTPQMTPSVTPTATVTITPTPTATITPTVSITPIDTIPPTPFPEPVVVVNQAFLCIEGACILEDTAVNAPFRTYLPLVTK